jgi:hypothetical protein
VKRSPAFRYYSSPVATKITNCANSSKSGRSLSTRNTPLHPPAVIVAIASDSFQGCPCSPARIGHRPRPVVPNSLLGGGCRGDNLKPILWRESGAPLQWASVDHLCGCSCGCTPCNITERFNTFVAHRIRVPSDKWLLFRRLR